jgi:hypothetical protein
LQGDDRGVSQTNRKDERAEEILVKGLIAVGIIVASTLAGPVWAALTMNAPTYNQDLQATLFGFLVGVILVLTALLAKTK